MNDITCEGRSQQENRQPSLPPLTEDDQEHAEIDYGDGHRGDNAGVLTPVRDQRLHHRRHQQRCKQEQVFSLANSTHRTWLSLRIFYDAPRRQRKVRSSKSESRHGVSRVTKELPSSLD